MHALISADLSASGAFERPEEMQVDALFSNCGLNDWLLTSPNQAIGVELYVLKPVLKPTEQNITDSSHFRVSSANCSWILFSQALVYLLQFVLPYQC